MTTTALGTLGWVIAHAAWQAAVVGGVLAIFLRYGRAPARLRYAAAFGALLTLVALSLVTAFTLTAGLHRTTVGGDGMEAIASNASGAGAPVLVALHAAVAPATTWAAAAWLAAVAVLLVRWCGGWWIVGRIGARAARPARPAWQAALAVAAARTGVTWPVTLLESTRVDTPAVVGHRRPVVLLPIPAFEALGRAEAESVLAHELAHVRRADFVANGVQSFVEILFFFHPAARWMSRTVRAERELCCDDVAVQAAGSRVVYARALARLESVRSSLGAGRLALAASGGSLIERLQRLADQADYARPAGAFSRLAATLAAGAALASFAAVGQLVFPPTLQAIATRVTDATRYTVRAHDPAGEFSITFERGRPTRATVGGVAVEPTRLLMRGDSLYLPWRGAAGYFAVRLKPDGFTWTPRRP